VSKCSKYVTGTGNNMT